MKPSSLLLSAVLSFTLAGHANAQSAPDAQTCNNTTSADMLVEQAVNAWRSSDEGQAFIKRDADGQLTLLVSNPVLVLATKSNPQFGKMRERAFAEAFLATQAQFIQKREVDIQTEITQKFLDNTNAPTTSGGGADGTNSYLARIGEKSLKLTEAALDSALLELGVPEDEIRKTPPTERVTLFETSITSVTRSRAAGQIAGILPIKNFEAIDCAGNAAVATLSAYSEKTREFARDIAARRPIAADAAAASGKTLAETASEEIASDDVIDIFGLRRVTDQSGYPSLVSYAQWSYTNTGATSREQMRLRNTAMKLAEGNAQSQLALFVGGTAVWARQQEQQAAETTTRETTGQESRDITDAAILESILEETRAKSAVKLQGITTLGTWTKEHPDAPGVMLVGVIMAWSPQFADAINEATGSGKRQSVQSPGASSDAQNGSATVRSSKAKNNAADF